MNAANLCTEHGGHCAYTGTEDDRCPWCHCPWSVVLRSGWHSCEKAAPWRSLPKDQREWRVKRATAMRVNACQRAQEVQEHPHGEKVGNYPAAV